jgi:hypothetical protein
VSSEPEAVGKLKFPDTYGPWSDLDSHQVSNTYGVLPLPVMIKILADNHQTEFR